MKREVLVNGETVRIQIEGGRLRYDRDGITPVTAEYSVQELEPGWFAVRIGTHMYRVMLGAKGEVAVNGRTLRMEVFDPRDLRAAGRRAANQGRQEVLSPMPGKVIRVLAAVGDMVELGQGLVVVEAMKMQNEMKSPKAGRVAEVRTKADATVSAGDVLVVIE
ncbi:MAG: biotin/lipoyl-containing protein [Acidobacteriota bacterium]